MNDTKQKILIVDDERYNITILVNILKSDYKTIVAKNGEEALKRATSANPPDLILLDIMMPDMDGYEVCKKLKAEEKTRNIPVIFVTAMSEVEDETKGLELGAIDYITKPISPPIVKARIKNHLELQLARQKLEAQNQELIEATRLREDVGRIARHDLKNPLNAIIGFPQVIMMNENLTENEQKYLRRIEEAGYRMLDMINRSLDLFKMERGIYQLQPVPVNIVRVIRKITVETHRLTQQKSLSLGVLLDGNSARDEDTFTVQGEELLCYSMLANLIKNALEASPKGERVTVELDEEDAAIIRIHNKGAVPEQIRDRFFEKYVTSGKNFGTGLGTYSAKLIAETQNGNISLSTSEEDGTTITIRFPI